MVGSVEILIVTIYVGTSVVEWVITYSRIMDPEQIVDFGCCQKEGLGPAFPSAFNLVYSGN